MPSLQLPKDLEVLRLCMNPKTRWDIKKHFGNHYATTFEYVNRLEEMGLLFVVKKEKWQHGNSEKTREKKWYLITGKGRAVLRGYEEAERR